MRNDIYEEQRKQALAQFLDISPDEIEIENDVRDESATSIRLLSPEGAFYVLTEEEADKAVEEYIENFIDDLGIDGFTPSAQEYILENYAEWSDGEDYMRDDYESYYHDIESESASDEIFTDRLQEELFEKTVGDWRADSNFDDYRIYRHELTELSECDNLQECCEKIKEFIGLNAEDIITPVFTGEDICTDILINGESTNGGYGNYSNELISKLNATMYPDTDKEELISQYLEEEYEGYVFENIKEWFEEYEDNKDDLIDEAVQSIIDEYDSPLEWAKFEFGKEFLEHLKKEGELEYDYKGIAEYCSEMDGRGNSLSPWDGRENEEDIDGTTFYIYQQDDCDYSKKAEIENSLKSVQPTQTQNKEI